MVRNNTIKTKAIGLRKSGNSYLEISKLIKVPKSTLSTWFSKESWSNTIKDRLLLSQRGNSNNLIEANKERKRRTLLRHQKIVEEANIEYLKLKKDPLFLKGICLYWGEGEKTESGRVSVVNTDSKMLVLMAKFYRKCLRIADINLRVGLFIYKDIDLEEAMKYWSNLLAIPLDQFIKTQILKSKTRLTKNRSKYGICSLYCSNTALSIKIKEWIRLVGNEI